MDNNAFNLITKSAEGLPHSVKAVLFEILKYLDLESGIATGFSIQDLEKSLWVEKTQGRRVQEVNKESIRSYFRTMERCSDGLIRVISNNKKLSVFFPLIKEANETLHAQDKVYADKCDNNTEQSHSISLQTNNFLKKEDLQESAKVSTPSDIYITKNYNLTKTNKAEISDDFFPSEDIIALAKEQGLCKVEDSEEIQKFIAYNKKHQTCWDDFNPVFLKWLVRDEDYQAKKQKQIEDILKTRSVSHANPFSNSQDRSNDGAEYEFDFSAPASAIPEASARKTYQHTHTMVNASHDRTVWSAIS